MPRYFIEVAYKGTRYAGFQIQQNANTIQAEVEKAFNTIAKPVLTSTAGDHLGVRLTGSSRTDAGVHALQNFFHFDTDIGISKWKGVKDFLHLVYKLNAILPGDIVIKNIQQVHPEAHCRFDAISREYIYSIHRFKNPFLQETSFFFPYRVKEDLLHEAAQVVKSQTNFFAFAKSNSQVKNFNCILYKSEWKVEEHEMIYQIEGNRFLRGMVRMLTASILKVARGSMSLQQLKNLFHDEIKAGYSVPAHGLLLNAVKYPEHYFHSNNRS